MLRSAWVLTGQPPLTSEIVRAIRMHVEFWDRVGLLGCLDRTGVVGGPHRDGVRPGLGGLPVEAPQPPRVVGVRGAEIGRPPQLLRA